MWDILVIRTPQWSEHLNDQNILTLDDPDTLMIKTPWHLNDRDTWMIWETLMIQDTIGWFQDVQVPLYN